MILWYLSLDEMPFILTVSGLQTIPCTSKYVQNLEFSLDQNLTHFNNII